MVVMAMLAKPASTRALLIAQTSPAMGAARLSSSLNGELSLIKVGCSSTVQSSSLPKHTTTRASLIRKPLCFKSSLFYPHDSDAAKGHKVLGSPVLRSGEIREHSWNTAYSSLKQKHFSTSGSPANGLGNRNETAQPNSSFNNQPPANNGGYPQQQPPPLPPPPPPRYPQPQQPGYASSPNTGNYNRSQPPTYPPGSQNPQQPASPGSTHVPTNQNSGQPPVGGAPPGYTQGVSQGSNAATTGPAGGAPAGTNTPGAPRTSTAAEVIDKYLGPSTLKLEKRDDKAPPPPPPPPPPRRNYGPQGTQEKKSGKDLVAESAACAVIEKYLGPWPGFPPRDPKIDEYLDSLPENAACAAIDKYFGPYKPLFVFKNKENAENPPPPSRPPRNRMMSRARNRSWNASQQGASVDRPWTAPHQSGPNTSQGTSATPPTSQGGGAMPSPQGVGGGPPPQGAAAMSPPQGSNTDSSSQGAGGMPPSQAGGDVRQ